jgi:hypothetical protein
MGNSDYKVSSQPGFVLVERPYDYEVVLDEQPATLAKISALCDETGCRKILILGPKTKVKLSVMDIYDLGEEIAKMHLQVAIAESHDASKDDEDFLETVVFNRGGPLQFFETEKEAKSWLGVS